MRRGMLLGGILVALFSGTSLLLPTAVSVALLVVLTAVLLLVLLLPRLRYAVLAFCVFVAVLSIGRGLLYQVTQVPPVAELAGETDTISGVVVECPTNGRMYTVSITQAGRLSVGSRLLLYCSDRVAPRVNETVSTTVEYRALYDSQLYRRADGVYLQAFPTSFDDADIVVTPPTSSIPWTMWLDPVRTYFEETVMEVLSGDEGALLTAMCLGDTSLLSDSVYNAFRACGLPHLIAVSGLHMTVIAGSLQNGLRRLRIRRRIIIAVTLPTLFFYMWLVGFTPSVLRSGLMYGVVLIGMLFRRQSDSLNSLGSALVLVLLLLPDALYDLGFWLSFGSTAGIICLLPTLRRWCDRLTSCLPFAMQHPVGWIADSLAITMAATLPLMPLMALTFRELSLVSPLANLLTVTPSSWMLVLGFLGILLRPTVILAWVGDLLLLIAGLIAKYMITVSAWLGSFPGATLLLQELWQIAWVLGACVLLVLALYRSRARLVRRLWCVLLVLLLSAHTVSTLLNPDTTVVRILNDNDNAVIVLEHKGRVAVLAQDMDTLYTARRAFEDDGYRYPTLLLLGEEDPSRAGNLAEWLTIYPDMQTVTTGTAATVIPQATALSPGDTVQFWEDHAVLILEDGWWLLTMGESTLLIAPPSGGAPPEEVVADGCVLFADTLPVVASVNTAMVFCIAPEEMMATADGPLVMITEKTPCRVLTDGDGDWEMP